MAVAVTENGKYAVSSHRNNSLYLWNLKDKSSDRLSDNANIYSANFVQGSELILWQDLEDTVYVQTLDGEVQKQFSHFPTYGHTMSDDRDLYLSASETWDLFEGQGEDLRPILRDSESPSFIGSGKLLNIALSDSDYFLTAGKGLEPVDERPINEEHPVVRDEDDLRFSSNYAGVVLWSQKDLRPIAKLPGNSVKTHATISSDGRWVVSSDENGIGLYWETDAPEKSYRLARYYGGIYLDDTPYEAGDPRKRDTSELIEAPKGVTNTTIALAFIHKSKYYLRFGNYSHQAALFKTGSPWPQKYFDLGEEPYLVTYGSQYSRNTAIASSPEAGVLVMGHAESGGISVYRFDEEKLTLERVWVKR